MTNPLAGLMKKEMTRQEFLTLVGVALVSIVGLGRFIQLLGGKSLESRLSQQGQVGYGSSSYGGKG